MVLDDLVRTDRIGYLLTPQPPQWARQVVDVEGLDRLAEYPGVHTVALNRKPGDGIDWRRGSFEFVFSVLGAAADHEGVLEVQAVHRRTRQRHLCLTRRCPAPGAGGDGGRRCPVRTDDDGHAHLVRAG